jgi:hypothetical protein
MLPPLDADSALRSWHVSNDRGDDLLGADAVGVSREIRKHAMPQHRLRYASDILRRDCRPSGEQRVCLGAQHERLPRARAGTPSDVPLDEVGRGR